MRVLGKHSRGGNREDAYGMFGAVNAFKNMRQTGISLRLDLGPNPDYRDIAKWARTSPAMIASFYDQTHPQQSAERIVGFRKRTREPRKARGLADASPRSRR